MSPRPYLLVLFAAALALSACGKRGTLERPPPMWGEAEKAKYEAEQAAEKAKQATDADKKDAATRYKPAPESQNVSIRMQPVDGAPRDPRSGPGQPNDPGQ